MDPGRQRRDARAQHPPGLRHHAHAASRWRAGAAAGLSRPPAVAAASVARTTSRVPVPRALALAADRPVAGRRRHVPGRTPPPAGRRRRAAGPAPAGAHRRTPPRAPVGRPAGARRPAARLRARPRPDQRRAQREATHPGRPLAAGLGLRRDRADVDGRRRRVAHPVGLPRQHRRRQPRAGQPLAGGPPVAEPRPPPHRPHRASPRRRAATAVAGCCSTATATRCSSAPATPRSAPTRATSTPSAARCCGVHRRTGAPMADNPFADAAHRPPLRLDLRPPQRAGPRPARRRDRCGRSSRAATATTRSTSSSPAATTAGTRCPATTSRCR